MFSTKDVELELHESVGVPIPFVGLEVAETVDDLLTPVCGAVKVIATEDIVCVAAVVAGYVHVTTDTVSELRTADLLVAFSTA